MACALGMIRKCATYLDSSLLKLLVECLTLSHVDYCSPVWSSTSQKNIQQLQVMQNKAARLVLHCDFKTPVQQLHASLSWQTVKERILVNTVSQLQRSQRWRSLRNKVNTVVRQAKNWHYRHCIEQLRGEAPRKWWECINRELGRSRDSGRVAVTDELSAESISQHFAKAWCQSESLHIFPLPSADVCPDLCSIGEVKVLLKTTNPVKSSGPDNVPNWVLKDCAEDLAPVVCHLFNTSYAEGTVPTVWKSANVVPVPKSAGASQEAMVPKTAGNSSDSAGDVFKATTVVAAVVITKDATRASMPNRR
ncbi:hypothetical protein Bbelb_020600 [Branchiostoma belcheri]|nr:hypothetical protein Bbelb_020600 [Branchiostoma belcheri]